MVWDQLKTKKGKGFILAIMLVFAVALLIVSQVSFSADLPLDDSPSGAVSASMLIVQGAKVVVYSTVFTLLCAIPLGFLLLDTQKQT